MGATHASIQAIQLRLPVRRPDGDDQGRVALQVIDNGPGISPDIQEKIFIPFFTTNKGGIRNRIEFIQQIIRLHKGTISVSSDSKSGSTFAIRI